MEKSYTYRSLEGLKVALIVLLSLHMTVILLSMGSSWLQIQLLQGPFTAEEADMNNLRERGVTLLQLGVYFTTAIVFAVWIVRAHKNARAFGAHGEITPGWAVGYFFLPIVNLWRPYQAMKELWIASVPGRSHAPLLRSWWLLWILTSLMGYTSRQISKGADSVDDLAWASQFDILAMAVGLPLTALALGIVLNITRAQTERAGEVEGDGVIETAEVTKELS